VLSDAVPNFDCPHLTHEGRVNQDGTVVVSGSSGQDEGKGRRDAGSTIPFASHCRGRMRRVRCDYRGRHP